MNECEYYRHLEEAADDGLPHDDLQEIIDEHLAEEEAKAEEIRETYRRMMEWGRNLQDSTGQTHVSPSLTMTL